MYSRDFSTRARPRVCVCVCVCVLSLKSLYERVKWVTGWEDRGSEEVTYQVCLSFHNMEQQTGCVVGPNAITKRKTHLETISWWIVCSSCERGANPKVKHLTPKLLIIPPRQIYCNCTYIHKSPTAEVQNLRVCLFLKFFLQELSSTVGFKVHSEKLTEEDVIDNSSHLMDLVFLLISSKLNINLNGPSSMQRFQSIKWTSFHHYLQSSLLLLV